MLPVDIQSIQDRLDGKAVMLPVDIQSIQDRVRAWARGADQKKIKKWARALRSGKYKRGIGALCETMPDGDERWCCLGVAADVLEPGFWILHGHQWSINDKSSVAYDVDELMPRYDFFELNDGLELSFEEMADLIDPPRS